MHISLKIPSKLTSNNEVLTKIDMNLKKYEKYRDGTFYILII